MRPPLVLLIEDDELNRDMLERRLARRRLLVLSAPDGEQGVRLAQLHHPQVILMDMSLTGIDGWEAIRQIKSRSDTAMIPIIALTGHVSVEDRERALSSGCHGFVPKPINLPVLLESIWDAVSPA